MGNEFSDKLKGAVEQGKDKLDVLKDKASNSATEAKHRTEEKAADLKTGAKHRTEEKAADLKTGAKEKMNDLKDRFSDQ